MEKTSDSQPLPEPAAGASHIAAWKAQTEYCGEFTHNGSKWCLNFFAVDDADAEAKVQSIRQSMVVLGRLEASIPWSE